MAINGKSIFAIKRDAAHEAALGAEADADVRTERVVSNERVIEWMKSWGTANDTNGPDH